MHAGRLTRKALILGIGRAGVVASTFLVAVLLSRWWPTEMYGEFRQLRLMVYIAALLDLGLPLGLLQATSGLSANDRREAFHRGFSLAFAAGLLVATGMTLYGILFTEGALLAALPFAGIMVAATIPSAALESALVVDDRHVRASVISGSTALAGVAATVVTLILGGEIAAVFACLAGAALLRVAILWHMSGVGLPALPNAASIPLAKLGLKVSANQLLGRLSAQIDQVVVISLFSATTFAQYANGAWEVPFMAVFFGAITSAALPEMSDHWKAGRVTDMVGVWHGAMTRAAWIVLPLWVWAWIWAPELIRILFSAKYEAAIPVFRIYLLALPVRVAIFSAILIAAEETRVLLRGAAIDVGVNITLSLVLAMSIGWLGPAIATVAGTLAQVAYYLYALSRRLGIGPVRIVPWMPIISIAAAASFAVMPTILLRKLMTGDVMLVIASSLFAAIIAGGIFLLAGRITLKTNATGD
jgi:O-antigen/teichoic acid export membrane protein